MAWVPKSEMTSASWLAQKGHFGAPRGASASSRGFRLDDPIAPFLEAAEHVEGVAVDRAGLGPPPHRVPLRPVDLHFRLLPLELLGQAPPEFPAGGPEPFHRLSPGLGHRRARS